ncbi:MAG: winged helix-turn-helix domain-containing protein [Deltaproteobacteria bacterium]|nr:winged helix-turn-helix domain-containing protein [Deltaproteobacteria bacterium]
MSTNSNAKNYHTRQSIADRIYKKFGIKVSLLTVSRLLKKHGFKFLKEVQKLRPKMVNHFVL